MGRYFTEAAWALKDPWIGDVRFTGLLGGIELVEEPRHRARCSARPRSARSRTSCTTPGMLITVSGLHGNVLRLQPPLSITSAQIDQFIAALRKTLRRSVGQLSRSYVSTTDFG